MTVDRVLSLGAGVQSSTLLLMAVEGELQIDAAIFADTGWEPQAVYRHLDWLQGQAEVAGIPVYRVSAGAIRDEALTKRGRFASMPLHLLNTDGSKGQLKRQCTSEYKIRPIRRQLRALGAGQKAPVEMLMGISRDEWTRVRDSGVRYITNVYPLIERNMTRTDCLGWLAVRGYPTPPKSACIGCPFHGDASWRRLKIESPAEFADAVDFDRSIRANGVGQLHRLRSAVFLHPSLIPLDEVDLRSEQDRGQLDLFGEECAGVCGV